MKIIKLNKILLSLFVISTIVSPVHAMYYNVLYVETGVDSDEEPEIDVEEETATKETQLASSLSDLTLAPARNLLENEIILRIDTDFPLEEKKPKGVERKVGYLRDMLRRIAVSVEKEIGPEYQVEFSSTKDDAYFSVDRFPIKSYLMKLPVVKCSVRITSKTEPNSIVPNEVLAHAYLKFYGNGFNVGFGYDHCWWDESEHGKQVLDALAWQSGLSDKLARSYVHTREELLAIHRPNGAK